MVIPKNIRCESILICILYLVNTLSLYEDVLKIGRPYVYSTILIIQLSIIKSWMRLPSNNILYSYLLANQNGKLFEVCKMQQIPDRRTIDRRFKNLPLSDIIANMGHRFVSKGFVDNESSSIDSSMLEASGPQWHKSDIKQNRIPIAGIDTDAQWGYSGSKGYVWGYKLHMICSVGKLIVPLSAGITTANVHDSKMFQKLIEPLLESIKNILADPAYADSKLYDASDKKNHRLICPIKVYPSTPPDRIKRAEFYHCKVGQELYAHRKTSIEPLFEIIKDIFGIRTVPTKGFENVQSFVLTSVLVYQLAVYYNCMMGAENPRLVKRMLCC